MAKLLLLALLAFSTTVAAAPAPDVQATLASGESYRDQGNYALAASKFSSVLAQAEQMGDKLTQAMATAALGYNYYLARDNVKAQPLLEKSSLLVKSLNSPALAALIDDYLGMLYLSLQQPDNAAISFANALKNAQIAHNDELIVGIRVNQAELETNAQSRLRLLENVSNDALKLNNTPVKINLLLAIGEQLLALATDDTATVAKQQLLKSTYYVLDNAYQLADTAGQVRLRSQAEGYLARLYAAQRLNQDALAWLDKAIFDAQQVNATDLLMQWEIQNGKLLYVAGDMNAALQAYQRAVKHLADVRHSLPVTFHNGHSSIKEIIDPIYRGSADIFLLQAAKAPAGAEKQRLLGQAIDAMETIKQNELEDFFNDRCLVAEDVSLNLKTALLPDIGIVYPIILPDRIELLFRAGESSEFEQQSVAISSSEVIDTAAEMAQYLRDGVGNYRPDSRKMYSWLLKAYDDTLKAKKISTVVYVPDGSLRQVPYAALLNGKKFAIEDYAIVTLPGLTLKKNLATEHKKPNALIAALSKPDGASVDELLRSPVKGVLGERGIVDMGPMSSTTDKKQTRSLLVEKLSLPSVTNEVSDLQKNMDNTTLLNQSFTYDGFNDSIGSGDYSIIHVASHGYFGKSADDSFVMTYDRNLKLRDFQTILSNKNIKKNPISLLTLSACQTAEGDDRALLGFSGIAIKTNAMSAIGTLWSVNDAATASFMRNFYSNLNTLPKAQALRQAQLALLRSNDLKHPYYWSPFVLVGNW